MKNKMFDEIFDWFEPTFMVLTSKFLIETE